MEAKIEKLFKFLKSKEFQTKTEFSGIFENYFDLIYDPNDGMFLGAVEKAGVIEEELGLCGYFVLVTSKKMTAKEAVMLYKSRDASEKLFRGDKSYLGNKSIRVYSDEAASAKIFIEFIALIIRSKIYTYLKEESIRTASRQNYMTVPAALKELEKIEMIRSLDGNYRLDHAITATQKAILNAFGIDDSYIKRHALMLNGMLTASDNSNS